MAITSFKGEYRWLSNFWQMPGFIIYNNTAYTTVEHAYQASKAVSISDRVRIAGLATPGQAKRVGRTIEVREDWDAVKTQVMLELTRLKYQNSELAAKLLATGDEELIEGNTWGDRFWGQCPVGVGENNLGQILMFVRRELRDENQV